MATVQTLHDALDASTHTVAAVMRSLPALSVAKDTVGPVTIS